jgi:hypothetical protein
VCAVSSAPVGLQIGQIGFVLFAAVGCGSSSPAVIGGAGGVGTGGAAGGAGGEVAASGGMNGVGGDGGSAGSGDAFVTGDVDGVTIRGEMNADAYWWSGIFAGNLGIDASDGAWTWSFVIANSTTVPNACASGYVVLQAKAAPVKDFLGTGESGACNVQVTRAASNVGNYLEGTFTATLKVVAGAETKTVTNGRFRVPRVADRP